MTFNGDLDQDSRPCAATSVGAWSEDVDASARLLLLSTCNTSSTRFETPSLSKMRKM